MNTGPLNAGRTTLPLVDITIGDGRETPTVKARRLAAIAFEHLPKEACPYANICKHCSSHRNDDTHTPVLDAQRSDVEIPTDNRTCTYSWLLNGNAARFFERPRSMVSASRPGRRPIAVKQKSSDAE
jgi:hypothetical protein